jgi:hypothetical protein
MRKHYRAMLEILQDWKERGVEKPRENLPGSFTSGILFHSRRSACSKAKARSVANCERWETGCEGGCPAPYLGAPSCGKVKSSCERFEIGAIPAELNPCEGCPTPGISLADFSAALFGKKENCVQPRNKQEKDEHLNKPTRVMRRLMAGAPMHGNDFRKAFANSIFLGWINPTNALTINRKLLEIEGTSAWLRKTLKLRINPANLDPVEVDNEIDEEIRRAEKAFLDEARSRIQRDSTLDVESRKELLATLLPH